MEHLPIVGAYTIHVYTLFSLSVGVIDAVDHAVRMSCYVHLHSNGRSCHDDLRAFTIHMTSFASCATCH